MTRGGRRQRRGETGDGRGGRPWARGGLTLGVRRRCPLGARRPGPLARRWRGGGQTGRAAERPFFTEEGEGVDRESGGLLFLFDGKWVWRATGPRGGKNTCHTFAAKIYGGMVPWRWRAIVVSRTKRLPKLTWQT
jgi:hypothetical protein